MSWAFPEPGTIEFALWDAVRQPPSQQRQIVIGMGGVVPDKVLDHLIEGVQKVLLPLDKDIKGENYQGLLKSIGFYLLLKEENAAIQRKKAARLGNLGGLMMAFAEKHYAV